MGSKLLIASDWEGRQVTKGQFETDRTILDCAGRYTNIHVLKLHRTKFTHMHTHKCKLGKSEKADHTNQCWF